MKLEIRISHRAKRDFADITEYISKRNPVAAKRVHQRIAQTIDLLAEFPYIGHPTAKPGRRAQIWVQGLLRCLHRSA